MTHDTDLRRVLTPPKLFAIAFGSIIGIGWIMLVGNWLERAGPFGAIAGFAIGAAAVTLVVLTYAEVALMMPRAGAEVAYAQAAFGPGAAFVAGWMLLMIYVAIIAFEMISVGWVLGAIWPDLRGPVLWSIGNRSTFAGELLSGLCIMVAIVVTNLRATNVAASVQLWLMTLKIAVSLLFIAVALFRGEAANLEPGFAVRSGMNARSIFTIFATSLLFYSGFNFLPQALEERSVNVRPWHVVAAMIASVVLAFGFYALVILATSLMLPRSELVQLDLPAAAAFEHAFDSRALRNLVLGAGFVGLVTAWNGTLLAAARVALLLGREGLIPRTFGNVHPKLGTPVASILFVTLLSGLLALCGRAAVEPVVSVAVTGVPLIWILVSAVAILLRRRAATAERPFKAPGGTLLFYASLLISTLAFTIALMDLTVGAGSSHAGIIAMLATAASGAAMWIRVGRNAWKHREATTDTSAPEGEEQPGRQHFGIANTGSSNV